MVIVAGMEVPIIKLYFNFCAWTFSGMALRVPPSWVIIILFAPFYAPGVHPIGLKLWFISSRDGLLGTKSIGNSSNNVAGLQKIWNWGARCLGHVVYRAETFVNISSCTILPSSRAGSEFKMGTPIVSCPIVRLSKTFQNLTKLFLVFFTLYQLLAFKTAPVKPDKTPGFSIVGFINSLGMNIFSQWLPFVPV